VLTGDKKETAINIGYSCKLLADQMLNIVLDEENLEVGKYSLSKFTKRFVFFCLENK